MSLKYRLIRNSLDINIADFGNAEIGCSFLDLLDVGYLNTRQNFVFLLFSHSSLTL